ncbi:MAG: ribulose-phosphate 3-epimerase [Candidatus Firestonebacteria bacterium]
MIKIAPSILSADYLNFERDIKRIEEGGADLIHIDVMDGNFVPNITFGYGLVKLIRKITKLPLDVHLMIVKPERYIDDFKNAGANIITIHIETVSQPNKIIRYIKKQGVKAGISLNPNTPLKNISNILNNVDMVLIMSVYPGFGGQKFIESSYEKIRKLKKEIIERRLNIDLEVDGGISKENAVKVIKAGANILVAGFAIFGQKNIKQAIDDLRYPNS